MEVTTAEPIDVTTAIVPGVKVAEAILVGTAIDVTTLIVLGSAVAPETT